MNTEQFIEQLGEKLVTSMGKLPEELGTELRKNSKVILQGAFSRLDLVTRDEFDAQAAVLQRTREKLEQLEQQLADVTQQPE